MENNKTVCISVYPSDHGYVIIIVPIKVCLIDHIRFLKNIFNNYIRKKGKTRVQTSLDEGIYNYLNSFLFIYIWQCNFIISTVPLLDQPLKIILIYYPTISKTQMVLTFSDHD